MIFPSEFKFDEDYFLASPKLYWSDRYEILHMARQLCCPGMCKILYQYRTLQWSYIKTNFPSNLTITMEQGKSEGFDSCDRPSNLKLDSNRQFFRPCDRESWWMTLQNNRAPLLCYFKLCASFRTHWWIQTWVTAGNAKFGSKSTIVLAVWPRNFTDDPQKQKGTSSMLLQALCIIS